MDILYKEVEFGYGLTYGSDRKVTGHFHIIITRLLIKRS